MGEQQRIDKPLRDLMEIIHFTENVSAKIHGLLDEAEIYNTVREEFARSKRYSAFIALLTEDGSKLRVAEAALPAERLKAWAKRTGLSLEEFQVDVDKSSICQVVREGKTLCVNVGDILGELFPRPLVRLIAEIMGFEKKPTILTPLKRHGKIMGAFAMSSTELAERFIPSVRSLAQHISAALELAHENAQRKRAEEALRESEKKFRSLMESVPIGIAISTPEEDVIEINAALWQIFGYDSKEDFLKIPASAHYYDPKERERFIEARKKGLVSFEARFKRKDGTAFWGFVTSISQTTAAGKTQFINAFRDITERKRAEEELRLHSEIMTNMVEGGILTRVSDGTIVYTNPKFEEMFGYGHGELIGKHISVVNAPTEKSPEEIAKDIIRSLRKTGVWSGEVYNKKKDGTPFWCYANVSTFEHPEYGKVWVAVHTDITERKQAEEALRRQRDELAARSAILSATLRTTDLDELFGLILDEVVAFLGVEFASIHLVQADQVVLRAWRGLSAAFRAQVLSFPADDPPGWMKELCIVHEHLNDVDVTPEFAKGEGIQAWASIPLRLSPKDGGEEKWLGTLIVGSRRYEALNEDAVRALQVMGDQLGLAIDHTHTYRQALERLARLQTLRDIDRAIIQQLDLREVLHVVLERVPKELGADAVAISLLDAERLRSEVFEMRLPNGTVVEEEAFELAESVLHWFVERQEPVIIYDLTQDPRVQVHRELIRDGGLVSYLGVPLVVHDKTIGILHIMTTEPRVFADEDVAFFHTMAGQAAIAIENARLYEVVKQELAERIEAEKALRESEERYRSLFDDVLVGLYRSTPEGQILDANPALVGMLGYPGRESLLTVHATDLYVDPEGRRRWQALIEREGVVPDFEVQWRRHDGTVIWVRDNARAVRDADGRLLHYEGAVEDITERKRTERLLQALNQAALVMEQALTPEEIFAAVAEELKKLGFSCLVLLMDESQNRLFIKHWSYEPGAIKSIEKLVDMKVEDFSIPIESADVYRKVIRERESVFVENVEEVTRQFLPEPLKEFAGRIVRMLKIAKSIPAPLVVEDEVIGVLAVESDDLTEDDIPAITAFAHQMAAAWRKAMLLQDLERSLTELERAEEELQQSLGQLRRALEGTVQALASTVERRDPYTTGHQRRVTRLACAIAQEMGLAEEQIEGLRMAGTLHDLGKIYVPAEILSKPGRLTENELSLIKDHPQVGYDILKAVEFPWPVAQMVLQHHERLDGSGYPQGLVGADIILEAKILAVADVVEAMASHRPYREARGIDKALEEISQNAGVLYDPEVVDACLRLFTEKGFTFE